MKDQRERVRRDRKIIMEMIDASWALAEKKGHHPLEPGCNCISCINKRKRILDHTENMLKYEL